MPSVKGRRRRIPNGATTSSRFTPSTTIMTRTSPGKSAGPTSRISGCPNSRSSGFAPRAGWQDIGRMGISHAVHHPVNATDQGSLRSGWGASRFGKRGHRRRSADQPRRSDRSPPRVRWAGVRRTRRAATRGPFCGQCSLYRRNHVHDPVSLGADPQERTRRRTTSRRIRVHHDLIERTANKIARLDRFGIHNRQLLNERLRGYLDG